MTRRSARRPRQALLVGGNGLEPKNNKMKIYRAQDRWETLSLMRSLASLPRWLGYPTPEPKGE